MHDAPDRDGRQLHIAVVGGGASGTLTAVQLLRQAAMRELPLRITLIDAAGRHGLGQAYSTSCPDHLLNAMAGQMSALPDDHDHLIRWAAASGAVDGLVTKTTFLPRQVYGQYLRDTLAAAEQLASSRSRLTRISAEVVAIRPNRTGPALRLFLSVGHLDADVVVLATGNAPAQLPFDAPRTSRIITDPWRPGGLTGADDGSPVVIVGTGLTMLDLAVAITGASPRTTIHAVSRHGLLPRPHSGSSPAAPKPMWLPVVARSTGQVRLRELMWQVRSVIAANPASWQTVMESLRPIVPGLWRRMPTGDKRLFLRHVARYWEVHRHLVPPPTASRIAELRCTGRLSVHHGRVVRVTEDGNRLRVLLDTGSEAIELTAGWLINATGAGTDIAVAASPLLRDLFTTGLARPDPLGLGIDASAQGAVLDTTGLPSDVLYTLGPPLRGLWYETTAIPEIREQAAALARRITGGRQLSRRPGSAA